MTAVWKVPASHRPNVGHAQARATVMLLDGRVGTLLRAPVRRGKGRQTATNVTVLIDGRHYRVPRDEVAVLAHPTEPT